MTATESEGVTKKREPAAQPDALEVHRDKGILLAQTGYLQLPPAMVLRPLKRHWPVRGGSCTEINNGMPACTWITVLHKAPLSFGATKSAFQDILGAAGSQMPSAELYFD